MKRDEYSWLWHSADGARQVLNDLDPLYCEACGLAGPTVRERVLYHATCDACQARIDEGNGCGMRADPYGPLDGVEP